MTKEQAKANDKNVESKDAQPAPKKPAATKSKKRGFFAYLLFMLLLATGSGAATYYATPVVLASLAPEKPLVVQTIPEVKAQELPVQQPEEVIPEEPETTTEEDVVFPQDDIIEVRTFLYEAPPVAKVEPQQPAPQPEPVVAPKKRSSYSVLKAMELRDAFKDGGECRPLLEELVAMPNKTPEMDEALAELLQSCLNRPIAGQMKDAFHSAKKRAILRVFQAKYPTYIAYIKALPYFLANIRKKNPVGNDPLDVLDRIQNAVDADHPQLVLKLIPELPENVQATLNDVAQLAQEESDLHRTLNRLMKALFDGEDR